MIKYVNKVIISWYYEPKSIPSETFPLATDSNTAPRPFSQACNIQSNNILLCIKMFYIKKIT